MVSVALPDGYVLAQPGNQPLRGIQLIVSIVGHVGHDHYHEPTRAARVHTSHYPILWKGKTNEGLQRSSGSHRAKDIVYEIIDFTTQCFGSC